MHRHYARHPARGISKLPDVPHETTLPSPPPSAKGAHVWRAVCFPWSDARLSWRAWWQGVSLGPILAFRNGGIPAGSPSKDICPT